MKREELGAGQDRLERENFYSEHNTRRRIVLRYDYNLPDSSVRYLRSDVFKCLMGISLCLRAYLS